MYFRFSPTNKLIVKLSEIRASKLILKFFNPWSISVVLVHASVVKLWCTNAFVRLVYNGSEELSFFPKYLLFNSDNTPTSPGSAAIERTMPTFAYMLLSVGEVNLTLTSYALTVQYSSCASGFLLDDY